MDVQRSVGHETSCCTSKRWNRCSRVTITYRNSLTVRYIGSQQASSEELLYHMSSSGRRTNMATHRSHPWFFYSGALPHKHFLIPPSTFPSPFFFPCLIPLLVPTHRGFRPQLRSHFQASVSSLRSPKQNPSTNQSTRASRA